MVLDIAPLTDAQ